MKIEERANELESKTKALILSKDDKLLGKLINVYFESRDLKADISKQEKRANKIKADLELEIIERMEEMELLKSAGEKGSVTRSVKMHPSVKEVESFVKWVVENDRFEMLQKRCSPAAVLEYLDLFNMLPPGIETYEKKSLNIGRARK